ncbi:MAG: hypothetical protein LBD73_04905, partial [Deferribacteraceae bacterium]|nr:hypothetical protein [Deferribacteraceae bacterium]
MKKIFILAALALTLLGGCNGRSNNKAVELRIATPYGLGYSPVYVISELKLMEKYYPNVTLSVKRYGSSISLRNAALEANADILFSSVITPITLKDTGLNFKIAAGIGTAPYELMVGENSGIQSLDNFTSQNRIVLHGFASLPHLSIYVALNNYFDNYSIDMDNISSIIQTMADPVGYNSLLTGDVTALFTTIPYTEYAREKGFRSILSSRDVLGDISLVASVSEEYYSKYPAVYAAFYAALAEAVELINTRDAGALKAISNTENIPIGELLVLLEHEGLIF